ncbi:hypothetical protein FP2506_11327 [Fulvimarina pelagi HTCC2506]|uniref:Uncharacterized protein n=1 Tax=Fulvimarina pelagi HTCC2506 TaxID=314231 RepID=Q0FZ14_9HYPH|nr:hypothetical protein [Fulvimarina pelagi]EAU40144.1 hypothetical protein FP2506_11327 [Fulvimarina pelagi HTCC2506]
MRPILALLLTFAVASPGLAQALSPRTVHTGELMMGNVPEATQVEVYCHVAEMDEARGRCAVPNDFGEFGSYWIDLDFSEMVDGPAGFVDYARDNCSGAAIRRECRFRMIGLYEERQADEWIVLSEFERYE